ncbi:MAG: prepilin-type N-terminal cleavage/methylation domain-containing protein [Pseudomonadota bacterium]
MGAFGNRRDTGFTLMEIILAVAFLGILAVGVTAVYSTGFRSMDERLNRMLLDGRLRSRMELLLSKPFADVTGGTTTVTVSGQNYSIDWNVSLADLDGDSLPESAAKQITVEVSGVSGYSLTTIICDNERKIGRL